jgi:Glycine rich protein
MTARTLVVICCAGAIVAGCGSRNASPLPNVGGSLLEAAGQAKTATPVKSTKATLTILVSVPRSTNRSPHHISAAPKGMTLAFKGPEKLRAAFGLTQSSDPHCKDANGVTTCRFTLQQSTGTYTANVAMFNQFPVNGRIPTSARLLSIANDVPFTVRRGKVNRLKLTTEGIIASLAIFGVPDGTAGTAFASAQSFTVTAMDAAGYVIVGRYETPVTLADSDTTGATTLATAGSDNPSAGELLSSSDTATLTYTGLAILPATITASAGGATNGSGTFTPALQPIVINTTDALNPSFVGVDLYATSGTGSTATFGASEIGWTNAPYSKTIAAALSSGCSSIATVTPSSGTSFAATVAASPSAGTCLLILSDGAGQSQAMTLAYSNFAYTGAEQSITIPTSVAKVTIAASGAEGSSSIFGGTPGLGAFVTATVGVTAGKTLYVYVGGSGTSGGFNGGGGYVTSGTTPYAGGASDVRTSTTGLLTGDPSTDPRIVVAAGGGSTGAFGAYDGGNGGAVGGSGANGVTTGDDGGGGGGATQNAGGAAGTTSCGPNGFPGNPGGVGTGGAGYDSNGNGGGGWFGGGGGGAGGMIGGYTFTCGDDSGGGGGGSSFVESSATNVSSTGGGNTVSANGQVTIIW